MINKQSVLLLISCLMMASASVSAEYTMSAISQGNGGSAIANDKYQLMSTIGQSVSGISGCNDYCCGVGFWCITKEMQSTVYVHESDTPRRFILRGNYPNPFNPSTNISFDLPRQSNVRLRIFSMSGQLVTTLVDDTFAEGSHTVQWKPERLSGGVYFYTIEAGLVRQSGKMLLLK